MRTIDRTPRKTIDFLVELNTQLKDAIGYVIRMEPGVQTCDETLAQADRLVPRLGLAAGEHPAAHGLRGPVRLGLLDSADGRREIARRPERAGERLHRPARLGRGLSAGAGWIGLDPTSGLLGRRRPHSAGLHAGADQRRPDHRHDFRSQVRVRRRDERRADSRRSARHPAVHRRPMAGDHATSATRSTSILRRATCGSRWAASRRSSRSTTWKATSGGPPPSARTSGGWPATC